MYNSVILAQSVLLAPLVSSGTSSLMTKLYCRRIPASLKVAKSLAVADAAYAEAARKGYGPSSTSASS